MVIRSMVNNLCGSVSEAVLASLINRLFAIYCSMPTWQPWREREMTNLATDAIAPPMGRCRPVGQSPPLLLLLDPFASNPFVKQSQPAARQQAFLRSVPSSLLRSFLDHPENRERARDRQKNSRDRTDRKKKGGMRLDGEKREGTVV